MNILLLVLLAFLASAAAVAGYRADKNGWIKVAWIPALVVRVIWILYLCLIALFLCAQQPVPESAYVACGFLTAAYLPWWFGIATSTLINRK
jgi:hypothetical protein